MARFITGNTFGTTDTVTSTTLNNAVNNAKISTDSVDGSTIELNSDALRLKDAGITTAKILDSSSKTTGVTFAKMQHISTAQVLGRLSASEGDVEEVGVVIGGSGDAGVLFDNDDMLDNSDTAGGSATRGATQQSIKAYVDTTAAGTSSLTTDGGQAAGYQVFASGLKMAWGDATAALGSTITFPSGVNFSVAPTVQLTYNDALQSTYFGPTADSVSTTNFVLTGSYDADYGPRYLAIGH